MDKRYWNRGGEVVVPDREHDYQILFTSDDYIHSLPIYAYCDPSHPVGWIEGEEVYQIQNADKTYWGECSPFLWSVANPNVRRIWIEPKPQPHKCQYCGAMTTQPDEDCWNNPKNHKFAEGEDDVANDFHNTMDKQDQFRKEAERLYPALNKNDYDEWTLTMLSETLEHQRAAHIAARQQSAGEVEELRRENERLKDLIYDLVTVSLQSDNIKYHVWQQFKTENNIQ